LWFYYGVLVMNLTVQKLLAIIALVLAIASLFVAGYPLVTIAVILLCIALII
jgi:hypothetical protein